MKITVCVAIGVGSRTTPNQYNGTIISPSFKEGVDLCNFLNPYISKNITDIEKQRRPSRSTFCTFLQGKVFDSRPIATYTEIFIQIDKLVRKISTDKPFRTDRHTQPHVKIKASFLDVSVLEESGNMLTSTSNSLPCSNTSTNMDVKDKETKIHYLIFVAGGICS